MKLEVVVVPVFDVDLAKDFYQALGMAAEQETPVLVTYDSAADLAKAPRRAAAAHGKHEEQLTDVTFS
jgi:catechol 2,3-dioxygenase-like lactoylglutathione lyase family enzyme